MNKEDALKYLQELPADSPCVVEIWSVDDIQMQAEQMDIELTDEQAQHVLDAVDHRFDACMGINWDVIACHIDEVVSSILT